MPQQLLLVLGIFVVDRFQRRRILERERVQSAKTELAQAREIEKAHKDLKATQSQLIHAEKMASPGELTAGIAHEIQNPLNFVNNFSEISADMVVELEEMIGEGNTGEMIAITADLKENLQKIFHHGQRASSIVKGIFEHSRSGTGLGLSLSYDIIVKGHGGQMSVETEEGYGTTFIITLPVGD